MAAATASLLEVGGGTGQRWEESVQTVPGAGGAGLVRSVQGSLARHYLDVKPRSPDAGRQPPLADVGSDPLDAQRTRLLHDEHCQQLVGTL